MVKFCLECAAAYPPHMAPKDGVLTKRIKKLERTLLKAKKAIEIDSTGKEDFYDAYQAILKIFP